MKARTVTTTMIIYNLLLVVGTFTHGVLTVDVKKLFFEKDLSEFCKRRVIPSIFLGRHVVEASAFILHFTKLNLPYSCYISIRSESGSNLIMVLTLPNDISFEESCSNDSPQLLVYEMGETFGGYWGTLPEVMLRQPPPKAKYYTLKTTEATIEEPEPSTIKYVPTTTTAKATASVVPLVTDDFIRVEVPLVDVSASLVPGSAQPTVPFSFEEAFDYNYDVTPIPGVKYDTSILPLVQLSVRKQTDSGRRDDDQEPRYELDVLEEFTADPRLTLPQFTKNKKHKTNVNRRLNFGKNRVTKTKPRKHFRPTTTKNIRSTKYMFPTTMTPIKNNKLTYTRNSWEMIEKLMEKLKQTKGEENIMEYRTNTSRLAENISNMKHNLSIYLQSNLSVYNEVKLDNLLPLTTKQMKNPFRLRSITQSSKKLILINKKREPVTTEEIQATQNTSPISLVRDGTKITKQVTTTLSQATSATNTKSNIVSVSISDTTHTVPIDSQNKVTSQEESNEFSVIGLPKTISPITLVDHESWENIVQVAPSMAVFLNHTVPFNVNTSDGWSSLNETYRKLLERKKRAIQSISIDNGRPYKITTKEQTSTTTKESFNVADMQEFARMVELKDDEIHGRVALRYLKQYVGPAIYNICGDPLLLKRHVYLFNSSRIVLSLKNFTMSRISVILTGARTLLNSEMRCPSSQLECQVSGARVCVDSLAACDGVPNCGSYDIYDEDRLMCGAALGLQRNVYLAAFTFLALLLTLCYAVHYWLKRCVPKVADAFFVYTDGTENILFLDTIMRSPGDIYDDPRIFYRGSVISTSMIKPEFTNESKKIARSRFFRNMFSCFRKKQVVEEDFEQENEEFSIGTKKTYSFMQMELSNITVRPTAEASVQTGESLEMAIFGKQNELQIMKNNKDAGYDAEGKKSCESRDSPMVIYDSLLTLDEPLPEDELSLMKFLRDSRSNSNDSIRMQGRQAELDFSTEAAASGEKQISSIVYDGLLSRPGPSGVKAKPKVQPKIGLPQKRLRFDEATTMIPTVEYSDDDDDEEEEKTSRQQVKQGRGPFGQRSWRTQNLNTIKEDDEAGGKHRHFWESKGKKAKKANTNLR